MSDTLRLYVNVATKTLLAGPNTSRPFTLPAFNKYETVPLQIVLVQPDPDNSLQYTKPEIGAMSLRVAVNDTYDDGTPLAQQTTFNKDTTARTFTGELALNTSGFNSWLGSSASKTGYFEIEVLEGTARRKVLVVDLTVKNSVQQVTTTAPAPEDEYYTKAEIDQMFAKFLNAAGYTITFRSPAATFERIIGVGDDGTPIDQIAPV